ncbi:Putative Zn(2)-C6 fungal-type DNA-bindingFT domain protein [Lichtheimia ramosa]|uniref:Putative Zn(2)-C6 fungal-type DNA-bindingFT domain protein n=1 Tax=Lichtheimia ramosa TaxID=688394 RepID=A0A077WG69_9FUNG|nr:Putative Zn(2)-C6 fungal-type DNA-bindingFT domain protein [Lichtheimia ramosa]
MSNSVQDSNWVQQQSSGDSQTGPQQQNDLSSSNNNRDASSSSSSSSALTKPTNEAQDNTSSNKKTKRTGPKRRKVTHACVYCRRSHMTCDEGRPCQRCIKRNIGHLCHDEPKNSQGKGGNKRMSASSTNNASTSNSSTSAQTHLAFSQQQNPAFGNVNSTLGGLPLQFFGQMGTGQLTFASEQMGNEISVISKFLDSLGKSDMNALLQSSSSSSPQQQQQQQQQQQRSSLVNTTEKFYLTAADPSDGRLEDRLTEVINAKYEAGFLKPYNYVNGYARLQKYMDNNLSAASRQRILNVMGTFRPAFRSVAQSLTDLDLILVEEAFERLLLDYDRVFSSMGIPACLWRRTGEIYKGNKEFASLVNVPIETLREGRLCIYELMAEDAMVNYWEKYGNIAFDSGQKAVLTSCLLKNQGPSAQSSFISCCFSFTIRRDKYNIPTVIVGNFLPIQLQ